MKKYQCPSCKELVESNTLPMCDSCGECMSLFCDNCHQACNTLYETTLFSLLKRRYYTEHWCQKCTHPESADSHTPLIRHLGRWWPFSEIVE